MLKEMYQKHQQQYQISFQQWMELLLFQLYLRKLGLQEIDSPVMKKQESTCMIQEIKKGLDQVISFVEMLDVIGFYEEMTQTESKNRGQIFTPGQVAKDIVEDMLRDANDLKGDEKFLDPCCGAGEFVIALFDALNEKLQKQIPKEEERKARIIKHMIYATDKDDLSVQMTKIRLALHAQVYDLCEHVFCADYLTSDLFEKEEFWGICTNPPYIGPKSLTPEYKKILRERYEQVYQDKGDISYCFVEKSMALLKEKGHLAFLMSRYFLEAHCAKKFRTFIGQYYVEKIKDYGGYLLFSNAKVSPCIIHIKKEQQHKKTFVEVKTAKKWTSFFAYKKQVEGQYWMLMAEEDFILYEKLRHKMPLSLGDVASFQQGIITGCDKAFVIDETSNLYGKDYAKMWIKNSYIKAYQYEDRGKKLLFTELIHEPDLDFAAHLKPFENRLKGRREVQKGCISWWHIQWPRDFAQKNQEKIIFPYKASRNLFAFDDQNALSSADVYHLYTKDPKMLRYLLLFLNSKMAMFLYYPLAKKVGKNLYEFYPNQLERLPLDTSFYEHPFIQEKAAEAIGQKIITRFFQEDIDDFFYQIFQLSDKDINRIEHHWETFHQ